MRKIAPSPPGLGLINSREAGIQRSWNPVSQPSTTYVLIRSYTVFELVVLGRIPLGGLVLFEFQWV